MSARSRRLVIVALVALSCAGCASWKRFTYEGFNRDGWQQPGKVLADLNVRPGEHVADIGSGGGYFTFRLSEAVGPTGRVYAVDVDESMNRYVAEEAQARGLANVSVILAEYGDPRLPPSGVDVLFTCNTYHHIEDRTAYFANARKYLRPGARVAILDLNDSTWFPRWFGHFTPRETIVTEMTAAGYTLVHDYDYIPSQTFVVFEPGPAGAAGGR